VSVAKPEAEFASKGQVLFKVCLPTARFSAQFEQRSPLRRQVTGKS